MNDSLKAIRTGQVLAAFKAAAVEKPCTDCSEEYPETPQTAASDRDIPFHGYLHLYETPTGDGRMSKKGAASWDLDTEGIPIIWDRQDGDHTGMILGRVDTIVDDGIGPFGTGRLFHTEDPEAWAAVQRVRELIEENAIGWSAMFDDTSHEVTIKDPVIEERDGATVVLMSDSDTMAVMTKGRIRHMALVDTPAQPGARPVLGPPPALAAAAAVHIYPADHFTRWESDQPVPLQVTPDGRIWGHAAGDGCFRNGDTSRCVKYQRDPDPQLRNFHTGTVTLDNGEVIRAGALTCAGLHADVRDYSVESQRQHHENSTTVYAKVTAWEDRKGRLCISGSLVPGLSTTFTAQVSGLPVSVEKWPVQGVRGLTLVGAHAVPNPALPVLVGA